MKIGFIGMGIMGKPMAINLLNKGYDVTVNTRTQEKAAAVIEKGAGYCADQKQLAEQVDVLLPYAAVRSVPAIPQSLPIRSLLRQIFRRYPKR